MPAPTLHILPWTSPLPAQAAAWLARGWTGKGPLDLTTLLVVVPTRQSGRRLREALARHAAARNQAVFPPRVVLPEQLVAPDPADPGVASRHDALLAWVEVLLAIDLGQCDEVLPVAPPARTFPWAARLGREFLRVQAELGENGLRMADVPRAAGDAFPEAGRWTQLAALENAYDRALAERGLTDPQAARIARARGGVVSGSPLGIILLAVPDPLPLALTHLRCCAERLPVEIVVFGPEGAAGAPLFDAWGRPRVDAWSTRPLALPAFEERVHLCADPSAQAARLASWVGSCEKPDGLLAVGAADPEVIAPLRQALDRLGVASHDPEGRPRSTGTLHRLLEVLAAFAREPAFEHVGGLARCPDVLDWLRGLPGAAFSPARFLAGLDALHARHLPGDLADARRHAPELGASFPELVPGLAALADLHADLTRGGFADSTRTALARIFAARRFRLDREDDAEAAEDARTWTDVVEAVAATAARFPRLAAAEAWEVALPAFGAAVRFAAKPPGAVDLQGWLELLWEDAPHLVVAGLNDGLVPAAVVGDAFLPEALRERLDLKTNAARLARDAYLLQAMTACREAAGRCDVLLGKASSAGDPLRPSRLLLLCDDALLPDRVAFLFRDVPGDEAGVPWRRAWQLHPGEPRPITRMSVTAFRHYLKCPFRFQLRFGRRMESVDPFKTELDALDFGVLCHAALEAMGRDPAMRACTDAGLLREFLLAELERHARRTYGSEKPLPLLVQLESARQRLGRAAEVQARERREGWTIEEVERPFEFPIGGVLVRGKIDRIERHEASGTIRVLDYKTSDKAVAPQAAHMRRPGKNEDPDAVPEFARFDAGDGPRIWTDLQLPLYLEALAGEAGGPVVCGYFNLPKAAGETAVALWDDYAPACREAAGRCAAAVAEAVAAGAFWPPAELPEREDDFASLFHHGAAASVAPPAPPP